MTDLEAQNIYLDVIVKREDFRICSHKDVSPWKHLPLPLLR